MRLPIAFFAFISTIAASQTTRTFADSLRKVHHLPELAYAVISSDKVYEMEALGVKRVNSAMAANMNDRFRIGSNTKCITAFIAALLVKEGKIKWTTRFFELFPELRPGSDKAHELLTLLDLLSMRTHLYSYTYTYAQPEQKDFQGDDKQQRYAFTSWFLKQPALTDTSGLHFSNLGYVAAGLMLEKASGKSYEQLVLELGKKLGISFGFGQPNSRDSLQPWGHDKNLIPEAPGDSYKLNWLLAAGNINVSLPDYMKFIQLQLKGLKGESELLSAKEFHFLHYGLPEFAVGWFWIKEEDGTIWSSHTGNPGTFYTQVKLCEARDLATLVFMNVQSDGSDPAAQALAGELIKKH